MIFFLLVQIVRSIYCLGDVASAGFEFKVMCAMFSFLEFVAVVAMLITYLYNFWNDKK